MHAHGRHIAGDGSSQLIADLGWSQVPDGRNRVARKALTPDMSSIRIKKARASPGPKSSIRRLATIVTCILIGVVASFDRSMDRVGTVERVEPR